MDIVLYKNQPAKRSHRKKYLYKLMLARSDINAAVSACKVMLEKVDGMGNELYYPLYASIVICYARPFTANKPQGALPGRWQKFDNAEHQEAHRKLLQARHELIAHSDMNVRKAMIVPPGILIGNHNGKELRSSRVGTQTSIYAFPIEFFKTVHSLAVNLGSRLNTEIEELVEELYGNMDLPAVAFNIRIDEGF